MDDAAWRVRVRFARPEDEERFLEWWKGSALASACASEPSGDGPLTFFYFPDRAEAEFLASALLRELPRLPIEPGSVGVDQWLWDEMRWSDESSGSLAEEEERDELATARAELRWEARGRAIEDMRGPRESNWLDQFIEALFGTRW